jgi:hypothetical protein
MRESITVCNECLVLCEVFIMLFDALCVNCFCCLCFVMLRL